MSKDTKQGGDNLFERPVTKYDSAYIKNAIDLEKILEERRASKSKANGANSVSQAPFILSSDGTENTERKKKAPVAVAEEKTIKINEIQKKEKSAEPKKSATTPRAEELRKSLEQIMVGDSAIEEKIRKNKGSTAKITPVREFVQTSFDEINGNATPIESQSPPKFVVSIPDDEESEFFKTDEEFSENKSVYENVTFEEHIKKITPENTITDLEFPADEDADEKTRTILGLLFQPDDENSREFVRVKKTSKRPKKEAVEKEPKPSFFERSEPLHAFDCTADTAHISKELYRKVKLQRSCSKIASFVIVLEFFLLYISQNEWATEFFYANVPYLTFSHIMAALSLFVFGICFGLFEKLIGEIASLRPGFLTMTTILLVLTLASDLTSGTFFSIYPSILYCKLYFNLSYDNRKLRIDSKLVLSKSEKTNIYPLENSSLFADSFGNKVKAARYFRGMKNINYFTRASAPTSTEKLFARIFFLSLALSAWFLFINSLSATKISVLPCIIFSLFASLPLGALFAFHSPYKTISKQLRRKSALIAGQTGIDDIFALDEIAFSDSELFEARPPMIAGIKLYGASTFEEVVLTGASIAYYLNQPILSAFMHILDNKKEILLSVEEAKYQDKAGIYAFLNGNVVVLGTELFLRQNMIRLPKDNIGDKIRNGGQVPLYLAINGNLSAVFSVKYSLDKNTKKSIRQLVSSGVGLLVSTTDPLLCEELLEWLFDIREDFVRVAPIKNRADLTGDTGAEIPTSLLISSKRLGTFIKTVACAFRLKNSILVNNILSLLAIFLSTLFLTFLIYSGHTSIISAPALIVYELLWTLPILIITGITKALCK